MFQALKGGVKTRHMSSFRMSRPRGLPNFVLLFIRTHGKFTVDENSFTVEPPQALLLAPNTGYSYGNPFGDYVDDWLHFSVETEEERDGLLALSNKPFYVDNQNSVASCLHQILWEMTYNTSDYADENIQALFKVLTNHLVYSYRAKDSLRQNSPYINQLQQLRLDMENSVFDDHSIRKSAHELNISESYFQFLYKELFGISFQKDLILMRVEHAKFMISSSNLSLEQIALSCGYSNEVHFYRQFKKHTGLSPAKYRKIADSVLEPI